MPDPGALPPRDKVDVTVQLASGGPNTLAILGTAVAIPTDGYIVAVSPTLVSGATGIPRGRYYLQLFLLKALTVSASAIESILWSGYWSTGNGGSIALNYPVNKNQGLLMQISSNLNGATTDTFSFQVAVQQEPAHGGGGSAYYEAPGTGQGEIFSQALSNPAAGSSFATVVVGTQERRRLRAFSAQLATDATAGNRTVVINVANNAGTAVGGVTIGAKVVPSATVQLRALAGGISPFATTATATTDTVGFGLGDITLIGGAGAGSLNKLTFVTVGIGAADAYTAGNLGWESWAMPGS